MGINLDTQATRSTLMSVDTTLAGNITATQTAGSVTAAIPLTSIVNFSTSVVAEIETTNEVISFDNTTTNFQFYSQDLSNVDWTLRGSCTVTANAATAPDGTTTANLLEDVGGGGNDIYDIRGTSYTTTGQALEPSFWLKKVSASGYLTYGNPQSASAGAWTIDLSALGSDWERITSTHAAVTVVSAYTSHTG